MGGAAPQECDTDTAKPAEDCPRPPNALTIDAEDWAGLICMYTGNRIPASPQFSSTILRVLDLLDEYAVRGTFFVVAEHAAQQPQAVREILSRGHELASHSWTHLMVKSFSPEGFREDLQRSIHTLEDIGGRPVRGHRCPLFSLLPQHSWAIEAMGELGLWYDSSIATSHWRRQGLDVPEQPFLFRLPSGATVAEFPVTSRKVGPLNLRLIGGRAARFLPFAYSRRHLEAQERARVPVMLYAHTYEIAPDDLLRHIPSSAGLRRLGIAAAAWAFGLGLGRLNRLVRDLLGSGRWAPVQDILVHLQEQNRLPSLELRCHSRAGVAG